MDRQLLRINRQPRLGNSSRLSLIALGFVVALTAGLATTTAHAGEVDNTGDVALMTGQLQGRGEGEALFIWEHASQKLAVYIVNASRMELLFVRDCSFDFRANVALGQMKPTVEEMEELAKKARAGGDASPTTPPDPNAKGTRYTMTLGKMQGGTGDLLYIYGNNERRLAVYMIRGKKLELAFLRDIENDLVPRSMGQTEPTPGQMKDKVRGSNKNEAPKSATPRNEAPKKQQTEETPETQKTGNPKESKPSKDKTSGTRDRSAPGGADSRVRTVSL